MSKYDIFISYCRADTRIAQQIYKRFEELGFICFLDAQNLKTGDNFANVIQSAIINLTHLLKTMQIGVCLLSPMVLVKRL